MDLANFRKQVNAGRAALAKRKETRDREDCVFNVVTSRGEVTELKITVNIKPMSCKDYEDYFSLTTPLPEEVTKEMLDEGKQPHPRASKYAATVIVGCLDDQNARIFSAEDIEFLDDPLNAAQTMTLSAVISKASGLTDPGKAEKKLD